MTNYTIGDFLIQIKNAARADKRIVEVKSSKLSHAVSKVLKKEGILEEVTNKGGKLTVKLAYRKKEPLLIDLKLVSKPGLRVYMGKDELEAKKTSSEYILSTPMGIMSAKEAIKKGVGGEVIVEVW